MATYIKTPPVSTPVASQIFTGVANFSQFPPESLQSDRCGMANAPEWHSGGTPVTQVCHRSGTGVTF